MLDRRCRPTPGCLLLLQTLFVGMMQYDGDLRLPARFLVPPPAIDHVSGDTCNRLHYQTLSRMTP